MIKYSEDKLALLNSANEKLNIHHNLSIEKNRMLIFVFTPPKVGSTSLVSSLRLFASKKAKVFHLHNDNMLRILYDIENVTIHEIIEYNKSLGKEIYVIDIYRLPIENKISWFFELICEYHFNNDAEKINMYNTKNIIKRFNDLFPHLNQTDYYKDMYNITLDDSSFDFEKKYLLQENNGIKYIKLRLQDSHVWNNIFKEIADLDIHIVKDYLTDEKNIKDIYNKFKEEYNIPQNYLKQIEEEPQFVFYNNEQEREEYISKWNQKVCLEQVDGFTKDEYILYNKISSENQSMSTIKYHHYKDEGCLCGNCDLQRNQIIAKYHRGDNISNEKVIHDSSKPQYRVVNKIRKQINLINKINRMNQNIRVKRKDVLKSRILSVNQY